MYHEMREYVEKLPYVTEKRGLSIHEVKIACMPASVFIYSVGVHKSRGCLPLGFNFSLFDPKLSNDMSE